VADDQALQTLLTELESGDPVEHYRPLRHEERWRPKLVVPQCVTRVYRGLWGDQRIVQPLLGTQAQRDELLGTVKAAYTPMRYRMDVKPGTRKHHWSDRWNVYPEKAAYFSTPTLTGRRPADKLWCLLLMYEFESEQHRPAFWINPLDSDWDFPSRGEMEQGDTFYVSHYPLPVSVAFVRVDQMHGTMKQRQTDAQSTLLSLTNDCVPSDEWKPPPRDEKPPPKRRSKLPRRYFA
jgi:hypothetical protein